ncbi:MAG: aminoacyl-tRNA hydrolase [Acidimicrobiales bacterium]
MFRRRSAPGRRTGAAADFLVVGLGNPGSELAGTRHNLGAEAVTLLAERHGGRLRPEKGLHATAVQVTVGGRRVMLAVPETYMNESGRAVAPLVRRAGLEGESRDDPAVDGTGPEGGIAGGPWSRLIVVHDELDLPSGRLRIKSGGGSAGNNGLKSIDSHLHSNDYLRVRVGIGKPPGRQPGADYVLKRPGAAERQVLAAAVAEAAEAVELIVTEGVTRAMNRVNGAG